MSKKVSGQNDTITAAIFAFWLICACAEFISKYVLTSKYVNINFKAFQSFMLILKNILKILTEMQNFVRMLVSLKCRNSYLKQIFHRTCFECIAIIRNWFFWCIVTCLSLTLSCKKNFLSMLRWLQITTDLYLKTVTISTYDRNLYHTP